jgi:hypothetical protein
LGEGILGHALRVADHAGDQPGHALDERHGGDLATAEDEVSEGDLVRLENLVHPLVEALVPPAQDEQTGLVAESRGEGVIQAPASGGQQDGSGLRGIVTTDLADRGQDRWRLQHHAGAAAVRLVVDLPPPVAGPRPEIVDLHFEDPLGDGPAEYTLFAERGQEIGEQCQDVETHRGLPWPVRP